MASPCELLMEIQDSETAAALLRHVANEAVRLEHKFSRYRDDSITSRINRSSGEVVREVGASDAMTKKVYESFMAFRTKSIAWAKIATQAYLNARTLPFKY